MKAGIFITGTNTGVGKTLVSALLLSAAITADLPIRYFKPIQTGQDSDCDTVCSLTAADESTIIQPLYAFREPLSPNRAAALAGKAIEPQTIIDFWQQQHHGFFIIEGAGGLMVPLHEKFLMRDLVQQLNIPLLIVATTALGTINHTLLTIEAAHAKGIPIKAVVLSGQLDPGLKELFYTLCEVPFFEIPYLTQDRMSTPALLKKTASEIWPATLLKRIFSHEA